LTVARTHPRCNDVRAAATVPGIAPNLLRR
jgi:hypothetical protein